MSSTALSSCGHEEEDEENLSQGGYVIIADHRLRHFYQRKSV
jgi:hypothetical protein